MYKGLAFAQLDGKRGVISAEGKFVVPPRFDDVKFFAGGVIRVQSEGKWGLIDTSGSFVLTPTYRYIGHVSDGLAVVDANDAFHFFGVKGFINALGELVIIP